MQFIFLGGKKWNSMKDIWKKPTCHGTSRKNYQKQRIPKLIRDAGLMPRLAIT